MMLRMLTLLAAVVWAEVLAGQTPEFKPRIVIDRVFPAITEVPIVDANQAQLGERELVLGVEIQGVARAYPINMLTGPRREIINDMLGQWPIAATW